MKIVIIGDGKVGYKLAKQLSVENYDVVMIDSNEKKLKYAVDRLDIACVTGDAADAEWDAIVPRATDDAAGEPVFRWRPVRPIPADDDFFENVWRDFRDSGNVY